MAENKGSSSNPAKGLVTHLDQNRSLQQDRFVGSSSNGPPGAQSFRSRPDGPAAAALDAAFTQFGNQARGMQLGGLALPPGYPVATNSGAPAFSQTANTAWADEFLHLRSQTVGEHRPVLAQPRDDGRFQHLGIETRTYGQISLRDIAQHEMAARASAVFSPPTVQSAMFPADRLTDQDRLADNAEQAMEAAFAAYDHDFEGAMDNWLEADGSGELEAHVENIRKMEKMTVEDDPFVSQSGLTTKDASTKPEKPVFKKFNYDYEMMKQAHDIVGTLSSNGSDEMKAKMNGSSFHGLMRAIASGKATVVDDNFIDTSTGEVIQDLVELSGVNRESEDNGNGLQNAADSTDSKGKGKDKMKSLQEQEQAQAHRDSAA